MLYVGLMFLVINTPPNIDVEIIIANNFLIFCSSISHTIYGTTQIIMRADMVGS